MPRYIVCVLLTLLSLGCQAQTKQEPAPRKLNLLVRSTSEATVPAFSTAQQQWLQHIPSRRRRLLSTRT